MCRLLGNETTRTRRISTPAATTAHVSSRIATTDCLLNDYNEISLSAFCVTAGVWAWGQPHTTPVALSHVDGARTALQRRLRTLQIGQVLD
eukprot:m.341061 g.341061  ORF g.341061 m.341061 type:complete len:91 (-) comp20604_c0_seq3:356-628(-)